MADSISGMTEQGRMIAAHWSRRSLTYDGAAEALKSKGVDLANVSAESLHTMDMLHMGGLATTDALAEMAGVGAGIKVLDVGSGVGGPARRFADKHHAEVWGIELAESSARTATQLSELVGLQDRTHFRQGSALALPYDTNEFDIVVMVHVAMQISEKDRLFSELARVLKPKGVLALHEIFGGAIGEPHFPLPWATDPAMSALELFKTHTARLATLGFNAGTTDDLSEDSRRYHEAAVASWRAGSEGEGVRGPGRSREVTDAFAAASIAMERNLREGRLQVVMTAAEKNAAGSGSS